MKQLRDRRAHAMIKLRGQACLINWQTAPDQRSGNESVTFFKNLVYFKRLLGPFRVCGDGLPGVAHKAPAKLAKHTRNFRISRASNLSADDALSLSSEARQSPSSSSLSLYTVLWSSHSYNY